MVISTSWTLDLKSIGKLIYVYGFNVVSKKFFILVIQCVAIKSVFQNQ